MTVLDRFLRYIQIDTKSDPSNTETPTTKGQWELAKMLVAELTEMGAKDIVLNEHCIVTASIPSTLKENEKSKVIGFLAHMDTSDSAPGNVKPQLIKNYDGNDILLDKQGTAVLSPKVFPSLLDNVGNTLVITDGTSLLGSDDKAGIAEIMTMAYTLLNNPEIPHGEIKIAFTPDEEGADGIRHFDVKAFGADFAYTVDGGALGEIEYENFNAAGFTVKILGREVHPGEAKGKMINAALLATEFASMLPANETPGTTSDYEGFYHLCEICGDCTEAKLSYILREHDKDLFQKRKKYIENVIYYLNEKYGEERFILEMSDTYYNMKEKILPHMHLIDNAKAAMEESGITPRIVPIRGGTDGARLSYVGLPCPNLSTGGYNFHGRFEYIPVESMEKMVDVLVNLAQK